MSEKIKAKNINPDAGTDELTGQKGEVKVAQAENDARLKKLQHEKSGKALEFEKLKREKFLIELGKRFSREQYSEGTQKILDDFRDGRINKESLMSLLEKDLKKLESNTARGYELTQKGLEYADIEKKSRVKEGQELSHERGELVSKQEEQNTEVGGEEVQQFETVKILSDKELENLSPEERAQYKKEIIDRQKALSQEFSGLSERGEKNREEKSEMQLAMERIERRSVKRKFSAYLERNKHYQKLVVGAGYLSDKAKKGLAKFRGSGVGKFTEKTAKKVGKGVGVVANPLWKSAKWLHKKYTEKMYSENKWKRLGKRIIFSGLVGALTGGGSIVVTAISGLSGIAAGTLYEKATKKRLQKDIEEIEKSFNLNQQRVAQEYAHNLKENHKLLNSLRQQKREGNISEEGKALLESLEKERNEKVEKIKTTLKNVKSERERLIEKLKKENAAGAARATAIVSIVTGLGFNFGPKLLNKVFDTDFADKFGMMSNSELKHAIHEKIDSLHDGVHHSGIDKPIHSGENPISTETGTTETATPVTPDDSSATETTTGDQTETATPINQETGGDAAGKTTETATPVNPDDSSATETTTGDQTETATPVNQETGGDAGQTETATPVDHETVTKNSGKISEDIFIHSHDEAGYNIDEGITHAFKRQLENSAELRKALGITHEHPTALDLKHVAQKFGFIKSDGSEVRVWGHKGAGYELKIDGNDVKVIEYKGGHLENGHYVGGTQTEIHQIGDQFEGDDIEKIGSKNGEYEYLSKGHQAPHNTIHTETNHVGTTHNEGVNHGHSGNEVAGNNVHETHTSGNGHETHSSSHTESGAEHLGDRTTTPFIEGDPREIGIENNVPAHSYTIRLEHGTTALVQYNEDETKILSVFYKNYDGQDYNLMIDNNGDGIIDRFIEKNSDLDYEYFKNLSIDELIKNPDLIETPGWDEVKDALIVDFGSQDGKDIMTTIYHGHVTDNINPDDIWTKENEILDKMHLVRPNQEALDNVHTGHQFSGEGAQHIDGVEKYGPFDVKDGRVLLSPDEQEAFAHQGTFSRQALDLLQRDDGREHYTELFAAGKSFDENGGVINGMKILRLDNGEYVMSVEDTGMNERFANINAHVRFDNIKNNFGIGGTNFEMSSQTENGIVHKIYTPLTAQQVKYFMNLRK